VLDAASVVTEAWGIVTTKLITPEDFRALTFVNPAMMHLSMDPDYFKGTVVQDSARDLLQKSQRETAASAAI